MWSAGSGSGGLQRKSQRTVSVGRALQPSGSWCGVELWCTAALACVSSAAAAMWLLRPRSTHLLLSAGANGTFSGAPAPTTSICATSAPPHLDVILLNSSCRGHNHIHHAMLQLQMRGYAAEGREWVGGSHDGQQPQRLALPLRHSVAHSPSTTAPGATGHRHLLSCCSPGLHAQQSPQALPRLPNPNPSLAPTCLRQAAIKILGSCYNIKLAYN